MPKKHVIIKLTIREISGVDFGAQQGADALIMKRRDERVEDTDLQTLLKVSNLMLTSDKKGHSHLIDFGQEGGTTSHNTSDGAEYGHSHPWVKTLDGIAVIGAAEGHTHSLIEKRYEIEDDGFEKRQFTAKQREALARTGKALPDGSYPIENKEDLSNAIQGFGRAKNKGRVARHIQRRARALGAVDMLPEEGALALSKRQVDGDNEDKEQTDMTKKTDDNPQNVNQEQLEKLQGELEIAKAFGGLNDVEKAHYANLDDDAKADFLKMDANARAKELAKALDADPVVYESKDGEEFRKSDDPRLVKMAKDRDADREKTERLEKRLEEEELQKRASAELGNVTGDETTKIALIKAVDGIEDEDVRKAAKEILASANSGIAKAMKTLGHRDVSVSDAEGQLEALAKKYQKENEGVTIEKARAKVLETDEGAQLYQEMQQG